jgi:hypothetical protein
MMADQISSIIYNETAIDRLKKKNSANNNSPSSIKKSDHKDDDNMNEDNIDEGFNEIFGSSNRVFFHYSWLLPVPIK